MFGAPKLDRFRSLASLILVVNVVGKLQRKRTLAASRGFLAAARLSCSYYSTGFIITAMLYVDNGIAAESHFCPSMTLRYRNHIGWNSSKIISRLVT